HERPERGDDEDRGGAVAAVARRGSCHGTDPNVVRPVMQLTRVPGMERKSFSDMDCSVAQCLEVVGEWWSLLSVRDAFLGVTRFDDFQTRLGISRNILTQRLNHLVENDVLKRVAYSDHP